MILILNFNFIRDKLHQNMTVQQDIMHEWPWE